jgi:hypothetical protein
MNQYPARPEERYAKITYMNYDNIADNFGQETADQLKEYLTEHPDMKVVVLAELTKKGNAKKKPVIFTDSGTGYCHFASYYGEYELFSCASHLDGFIEVFHNFTRHCTQETV